MQCLSDIFTEWYHRWTCSSKDVDLYYPTCTENKIDIALDTALDYYTKMKKWCRIFFCPLQERKTIPESSNIVGINCYVALMIGSVS